MSKEKTIAKNQTEESKKLSPSEMLWIMLNNAPDDVKGLRNRIGGEIAKISMEAGIISPDPEDLEKVTVNVLNSRAKGAPSFENVRTGINEEIDKYLQKILGQNWKDVNPSPYPSLPQDVRTRIEGVQKLIRDEEKEAWRQELMSESGRQSLISGYLKHAAFGNLFLRDSKNSNPNQYINSPQDKAPIINFISESISIPAQMLLLAGKNTKFAEKDIRDIIQKRIPEFFGPDNAPAPQNESTRLATVDVSKFNRDMSENQKKFAAKVNEDIMNFTRRGLVQKIVLDIVPEVPAKNKDQYNSYKETVKKATDELVNLMSEAQVPLSIIAYPQFKAEILNTVQDKKGNPSFDKLKLNDIINISAQIPEHKKYIEEIAHNAAGSNNPKMASSVLAQLSASYVPTGILRNPQFRKSLISEITNTVLQNDELLPANLAKILKKTIPKYGAITKKDAPYVEPEFVSGSAHKARHEPAQNTQPESKISEKRFGSPMTKALPEKTQTLLNRLGKSLGDKVTSAVKSTILKIIYNKPQPTPKNKTKNKSGGYSPL